MGKNYLMAMLVTFSVTCFSAFIMDLSFAPFLNQEPMVTTINIGGAGITDGVLFAGLFSLVWTTFFSSILALGVEVLQMANASKEKA
jgi:hypothetical protein